MPIIFIILLVVLIAQVGFWDTLGAVLGAAAMLALFVVLAVVAAAVGVYLVVRGARRRL
jgi:hypothetical protein